MLHGAQVAALLRVHGGVEQGLGEADDGVHGRADLVAHVGQESAARRGGLLGTLLCGAQLLLHGAALGQIGRKLDDLEGLALRVKNGVVGGLDPDAPTVLAESLVLTAIQLARSQLLPELRIRLGLRVGGLAEHAVVLAHDLLEAIAHQTEEVVIGMEHTALHVELHYRQRAVDGAHGAFELCVAFLEGGHVHDDPVNPLHLAIVPHHGAPAFGHPTQAALAVTQAKLHVIRPVLLNGCRHLVPKTVHLFRQR